MKVSFYRLFVEQTEQTSLLAKPSSTKQDVILSIFDRKDVKWVTVGRQKFVYKTIYRFGDYVIGRFAKLAPVEITHSADENFKTEKVESWPGVYVIANTSNDPLLGQSVAIESNPSLFRNPLTSLHDFVEQINIFELRKEGVEVLVNPITTEKNFWEIVKSKEGIIKSLTFDFAAPNLFGTQDKLNDELREADEQFGITNASFKLENSEGNLRLPEGNPFLQQGVKYITAGGGNFTLKTSSRTTVTSRDNVTTTKVDEDEMVASFNDDEAAEAFYDKLFLWLKHRG